MTEQNRRRSEGPRRSPAERKRQIVAHARRLFTLQGYEATTLEQLAEAAAVAAASLAKHFPDKTAVLEGIVNELREAASERWPAEAAAAGPLPRLHALTDLYLDLARSRAEDLRLLSRLLLDESGDALPVVRSLALECEAFLARVIVEGQQSGVFRRSLDPRVGAWELLRSALGYTLTQPLGIPLDGEPDYLARALDCLLHCLLKTDV